MVNLPHMLIEPPDGMSLEKAGKPFNSQPATRRKKKKRAGDFNQMKTERSQKRLIMNYRMPQIAQNFSATNV